MKLVKMLAHICARGYGWDDVDEGYCHCSVKGGMGVDADEMLAPLLAISFDFNVGLLPFFFACGHTLALLSFISFCCTLLDWVSLINCFIIQLFFCSSFGC